MCQGKNAANGQGALYQNEKPAESRADLDMLIENFDRALSHPDENDLKRLRLSVEKL